MKVDIWSDVVCPWCYIGKRRFETALSKFEYRDDVEVVWRSFELDRHAPTLREGDYVTRLSTRYGVSVDEAQAMLDRMTEAAAGEGLAFRFDIARPGNTFDAHRLLHLAADRGLQDAVKERLLAATFTEGAPIGDRGALVSLAAEAGLAADDVEAVLASGAYSDAVRADQREAAAYGIDSVPFFVIDGTYGLAGAHPSPVLQTMLGQAWSDLHDAEAAPAGDGTAAACDREGCAS